MRKIIPLDQANDIIQEICDKHHIHIRQHTYGTDFFTGAEDDGDVATFHVDVNINHDLSIQEKATVYELHFPLRIRSMPNHMTPEEMMTFADKCKACSKCGEELEEAFAQYFVKTESE